MWLALLAPLASLAAAQLVLRERDADTMRELASHWGVSVWLDVEDESPCFWPGVACVPQLDAELRIGGIVLHAAGAAGTLPPEHLRLLTRLEELTITDAALTGPIPKELVDLAELRLATLRLSGNALTGWLPMPDLAAEPPLQLRVVDVGRNRLSGFDDDFALLPLLERLDLGANAFAVRPLPPAYTRSLREFGAGDNAFAGEIPETVSGPFSERIVLANNALTGSIPPAIIATSLAVFNVSNNRLSGSVPPVLENRVDLGLLTLDVEGNPLNMGCAPGRFRAGPDACLLCTAGSFSTVFDAPSCTLCAMGEATLAPGASSSAACGPCAAGSFADGLVAGCRPCFAGTFVNTTGASACEACAPGTSSAEGDTACEACAPGLAAGEGALCLPCDIGAFPTPDQSACNACPAGTTTDGPGSIGCRACAPGLVSGGSGGPCEPCEAGSVPNPSQAGCNLCLAGSSAAPGDASCTLCEPGTAAGANGTVCAPCTGLLVAPRPGMDACEECAPGLAPNAAGTQCAACLPGHYETGGVCLPCGIGSFAAESGATACQPCAGGSFAEDTGTAECTPCAAGAVAGEGQQTCIACDAGTYALNATECVACPAGSVSQAGSSQCAVCPAGMVPGAAGDACIACAAGSFAPAGAVACTPCTTGTSTGGLAGASACELCATGTFAAETGMGECTLCPPMTFGTEAGATATCPRCQEPASNCLGGNECASGYTGVGCSECGGNFYRWSGSCLRCPVVPWPLIVLFLLLLLAGYAASRLRIGPRHSTLGKQLFFFAQVSALSLGVSVRWPSTQRGLLEVLSVGEIGLPSAGCVVNLSFYERIGLGISFPLVLVLVFVVASETKNQWRRRRWLAGRDVKDDFEQMVAVSRLRRLWISMLAAVHLPVVRTLMLVFSCVDRSDGARVVMDGEEAVLCNTSQHEVARILSAFGVVIVGLVLPALTALLTLKLRRDELLSDAEIVAHFGALFESYVPDFAYLESVNAVRKAAMAVVVATADGLVAQSASLLALTLPWLLFVHFRRPYIVARGVFGLRDVLNNTELVAGSVLVMYQATTLGVAVGSSDKRVPLSVGVALLVPSVLVLLLVFVLLWTVNRVAEVAPANFTMYTAVRQQRKLYGDLMQATLSRDIDNAEEIWRAGLRHAKQSLTFARWRQSNGEAEFVLRVTTGAGRPRSDTVAELPFLDLEARAQLADESPEERKAAAIGDAQAENRIFTELVMTARWAEARAFLARMQTRAPVRMAPPALVRGVSGMMGATGRANQLPPIQRPPDP